LVVSLQAVWPGVAAPTRPGTRRRAVVEAASMTTLNDAVRLFDPRDERRDP
jgi:hypothetical protein